MSKPKAVVLGRGCLDYGSGRDSVTVWTADGRRISFAEIPSALLHGDASGTLPWLPDPPKPKPRRRAK